MMNRPDGRDDGTQSGPGEQIRPKKNPPGRDDDGGRDTAPLSPPGDGRPTEEDLAQRDRKKTAPSEGDDK
jgi:hypothetical protein